jgi:iron complex transport system substrate-binding protein
MRICSLLPGATEIAYLLGLGDQIVGVTHECDYPPDAQYKPAVVRSVIDAKRMSSAEIDAKVIELLQAGKGLYSIDERVFMDAAPDLILTQGLCDVCALDYTEVVAAAKRLTSTPHIVSLNPRSLAEMLDDILRIGSATGRAAAASTVVNNLRKRIDAVAINEPEYRPRVVCLEWFEPLYVAGHWVPEMITLAGGFDVLGRKNEPSHRIEWREVIDANPDVILLMPCGFDVRRAVKESTPLRSLEGWQDLPAVKSQNVYVLNGNAYFSRPGPRLVNGLEILARILRPGESSELIPPDEAAKFN